MSHRIRYSLGWTANMGDFESLRVDLGLELDSKDGETPPETLAKVRKFVEAELGKAVSEVKAAIKED